MGRKGTTGSSGCLVSTAIGAGGRGLGAPGMRITAAVPPTSSSSAKPATPPMIQPTGLLPDSAGAGRAFFRTGGSVVGRGGAGGIRSGGVCTVWADPDALGRASGDVFSVGGE